MRIPIIELEGFEADDLLATLAKQAEKEGDEVVIVSGDRDVLQLVRDCVSVMMTRRGITDIAKYDTDAVVEKYAVTPAQWTDFVALKGENSDNLPGVPGIGDKTAAQLINSTATSKASSRTRTSSSRRSRPASRRWPSRSASTRSSATCSRTSRCRSRCPTSRSSPGTTTRSARSTPRSSSRRSTNGSASTTSCRTRRPRPSWRSPPSRSAATRRPETAGVAIDSRYVAFATSEDRASVAPIEALGDLRDWLADPDAHKYLHDAKPLFRSALDADTTLDGIAGDTMLYAYLLEPGLPGGYTLADVAQRFLGRRARGAHRDEEGQGQAGVARPRRRQR